jgi:membrane-associated protein
VQTLLELWHRFRDLEGLIQWGGYPALILIVFAETGLLVGFFLPGDSLLVTAGVLVSRGLINPLGLPNFTNLMAMNAVLILTAFLGDAVGFGIGRRAGPALFKRDQSFFFRKDRLLETHAFYEKHGGKTIIIARFMPFVRTFAPVVAGIGQMEYKRFAMFNIVGAFAWVTSMSVLGFTISTILDPKSIEKVVYLIIALSLAPLFIGWLRKRLAAKKASTAA